MSSLTAHFFPQPVHSKKSVWSIKGEELQSGHLKYPRRLSCTRTETPSRLTAFTNTLGVNCHQAPVHWNSESRKTRIPFGTMRFNNPTRKCESVRVFSIRKPSPSSHCRIAFGWKSKLSLTNS